MTHIRIQVCGAQATAQLEGVLTAGMVGVPVSFDFDAQWDDLNKTAVFMAGGTVINRTNITDSTTVPWEVLRKNGCTLKIGVFGVDSQGQRAIPTVWAPVAVILPGADPTGEEGLSPTLPIWKQLMEEHQRINDELGAMDQALDKILALQKALIGGDV